MEIYDILKTFVTENVQEAAISLLNYLGIKNDVITNQQTAITELFDEPTKAVSEICEKIEESYFACTISDLSFGEDECSSTFEEAKDNNDKYEQIFVFAISIARDKRINRSEIATLTRALNHHSKAAPVLLITRYYDEGNVRAALSLCERTAYKQAGHTGEKVGRVNILRNINPERTHTGHLRIIQHMRLEKNENTFEAVYNKWLNVFDNDVLTNQFYKELQNWFFWALKEDSGVRFPNDIHDDKDDMKYNPQNIIRLITRLIFVWFLREKGLVPKQLFNRENLQGIVKDFDADDFESSTYYRAILQNLFFATLNRKIEERKFVSSSFNTNKIQGVNNIKTFMRHHKDLCISEDEFIEMMRPVPFMNNSLFECLDNKVQDGHTYNWDGFSESSKNEQKQAFIPNYLFFAEEEIVDLSEEYGNKSSKAIKVFGLIKILKRYAFTVEENTPLEQDVALDPELLGKVFENLLAAYNPETGNTVRKSTGSYYTPRSIVQYMVDESLIAYISKEVPSVKDNIRKLLKYEYDTEDSILTEEQTRDVAKALLNCKILDPACGSGAFPMGILQQMNHLLRKIDKDNKIWEDVVMDRASHDEAYIEKSDKESRENDRREMEEVFNLSTNFPDYARKLYLIENCIYGVDIQSIAVQITRLRFFISLLSEQKPDLSKPENNYNIKPLPNLEMKFVAANSLIDVEHINETRQLFKNKEILDLIAELKEIRHKLFVVTDNHNKARLRGEDEDIRREIMLKTADCSVKEIKEKIKAEEDILNKLEYELQKAEKLSDEKITEAISLDLFGKKEKIISYSRKERIIKDLTTRINQTNKCIKSLNDIFVNGRDKAIKLAKQLTDWNPYDQNVSSSFFDPDWMFGVADGFDIVIGNPPYIQLEKNGGKLGKLYSGCGYNSFDTKGDIFCLFYERGWQMLKDGAHLCFITSNKWMRAGYGENLRGFFVKNTNPKILIDFAGVKIFESATVDANILLFSKEENKHNTLCSATKNMPKNGLSNLSDYIEHNHIFYRFNTSNSWIILSPIEDGIKQKIESVGKPLKEWDINIYRGVLTGYNDAFIINSEKRNEILSRCSTIEERNRTDKLIRPILRGRDIKRYAYDWADLWIINTHNGIKGKVSKINIEEYPSIKAHLDTYWSKISKRSDKGDTPYNLRNCAYLDDFSKPKVMWKIIGCNINFCFDENQMFCNNAVDIMVGERDKLIQFVGIMNSMLFDWYLKITTEAEVQGGGIQLYVTTLEKTLLKLDFSDSLTDVIYQRICGNIDDNDVENKVFDCYRLNQEERDFIINSRQLKNRE